MSMYKFKFENGDVIEMKAIKYSEFASETLPKSPARRR